MTLLALIIILVILGVIVFMVPMDARIKQLVYGLAVIFTLLALLDILGLVNLFSDVRLK